MIANHHHHEGQTSPRDFIRQLQSEGFDEIGIEVENVASDPVLDRLPQRRDTKGSGRIFAILDELLVEDLRAQAFEEEGSRC